MTFNGANESIRLPSHIEEEFNKSEKIREEIRNLANKAKDPHFENFDAGLLKRKDLEIYEKFKNGKLKKEEFEKTLNEIILIDTRSGKEAGEEEFLKRQKNTRLNFFGYLANKIFSWSSYKKNIEINPEHFKKLIEFESFGGKVLESYKDGRPKKWPTVYKENEKGELEEVLPPLANASDIIHRLPTNKEIKELKEIFGPDTEVSEISENPDKETKEDYNRWTGLLEGE